MSQKPSKWSLIHSPMLYQGWGKNENYFEGWYFKLVDCENDMALAFIPGISKQSDGSGHSFVQILDGLACKSYYLEYALEEFNPSPNELLIEIGPHRFSETGLIVDSDEVNADVNFGKWSHLPSKLGRPGIMGWYSYMPFMECYHGLGSFHHGFTGNLSIGGRNYESRKGIGYVEKDWGTSFPKSWIWSQCNTFNNVDELSVFASVAHIPWRGSYFIGFLATIWYQGQVEVFATYNRSKKDVVLGKEEVTLLFTKGRKRLEIQVRTGEGAELRSPVSGEMRGKVNESLQARMHVRFSDKRGEVVRDEGQYAGLEVAGPVEILLNDNT